MEITLPKATITVIAGENFGNGNGQFWTYLARAVSPLEAVASGTFVCAEPEVGAKDAMRLNVQMLQVGLRQYARHFPHSQEAALIRQGRWLEALIASGFISSHQLQQSTQDESHLPGNLKLNLPEGAKMTALDSSHWSCVIADTMFDVFARSKRDLPEDHLFPSAMAVAALLLGFHIAKLPFVDPFEHDFKMRYFQRLLDHNLILRPKWLGDDTEALSVYRGFNDLRKTHEQRVVRAQFHSNKPESLGKVYGLNTAGHAYFLNHFVREGVSRAALEQGLGHLEQRPFGCEDYPAELFTDPDHVRKDQSLHAA